MKNAIVLCSGGLDSVTCAWHVKKDLGCSEMIILFFDYGQKSLEAERRFSEKCALDLNAEFVTIKLPELGDMSTSLINREGDVAKIKREDLKDSSVESEKFYVPARNTVFLSYALAMADSLHIKNKEAWDIFVGFKNEGNESYPDTTKEFVDSLNDLAKIGFSHGFKVKAPFIEKDKEDIVLIGKELGVNFSDTFSCYVGSQMHCGVCLNCRLRQEGFRWANVEDPSEYAKR